VVELSVTLFLKVLMVMVMTFVKDLVNYVLIMSRSLGWLLCTIVSSILCVVLALHWECK